MTKERDEGYIGPSLKLEGLLQGDGDLAWSGAMTGRVELHGALTVYPEGRIQAEVEADALDVFGHVVGTVTVRGLLRVHRRGRLIGEFRASEFSVAEGASVRGQVHVGPSVDTGAEAGGP